MTKLRLHAFHYLTICILCILGVVICACDGSVHNNRIITVSIQPQKYLLEKIVGDKIDIMCLLSQGSNPEAYEPNFSHLINLEKSDAYFRIGNIGFELAIISKAQNNNPNLKIYNNSEGITFLVGSHGATESDGHKHEIDPHIWSSVTNAMIIAKNMYDAVIEIDPTHKEFYTKNYNALISDLTKLNNDISAQLKPLQGTSFAVWHPSLSYFARDYGMKQVSLEYDGKEASIKYMKEKIDQANKNNVKVFFFQKEFDGRQAEILNDQIGAKMVTINPMNYNWEEEIHATANALTSK
ncbi:MAG: zinc ABC transporter substrate-binding protein [Muribaculaceae bacterium]